MTKPITDRAQVTLEYPDKLYIGTFADTARFEAHMDQAGIALTLELLGPAEQHKNFHHALFPDILRDLAKTAVALPPNDLVHRDPLRDSARALCIALETNPVKANRTLAGAA